MHTYFPLLAPFFASVARTCDIRALDSAADRLHQKYTGENRAPLEGLAEHAAYAICRMPATFAATLQALTHVKAVLPSFSPASIVDLGTGPGTALLSSLLTFPTITNGIGLEQSLEFCTIAEQLFSAIPAMRSSCRVIKADLECSADGIGSSDMMISSYAMGELSQKAQDRWLKSAQEHAKVLVLVEPGTPAGWQCLMRCRDAALSLGARILAPCPHAKQCPFAGTESWCHEAVRLPRTALHRRLKGGELGYEDEKMSYLAVTFDPALPCAVPPCRIVHAPRHRHGHTHLVLCTYRGLLEPTIISRKYKDLYRLVRDAKWGDSLPTMKESVSL
jgi:ribosomal protein RSM22 (predicted rRNA methylase)